jgi:hypothetical protein
MVAVLFLFSFDGEHRFDGSVATVEYRDVENELLS